MIYCKYQKRSCKYGNLPRFESKISGRSEQITYFYAFDKKQFLEGVEKVGAKLQDNFTKIATGVFMKSSDVPKLEKLMKQRKKEHKERLENSPEYAYHMFKYELANHEYILTYDLTDTLIDCDVTDKYLKENPSIYNVLEKAIKDYKEEVLI